MENEQAFELLRQKRFFPIGNDITMTMAKKLQETVMQMVIDNTTLPIHLFINGNGGNLVAGLCIYDFLISIPNPVIGYVNGNCHSAALIALAGCRSKRLCTPHSRFQYHALRTTLDIKNVGQTEEDIKDLISEARYYAKRVAEINESAYGIPYDKFISISEKGERNGLPLLAEQAKKLGIIHEIVTELPFKFAG